MGGGAAGAAAAEAAPRAADLHSVAMHAALFLAAALPAVVPVPTNLSIVVTASLAVYVGSYRSCRAGEDASVDGGLDLSEMTTMERGDAMRFPLMGSAVLFGLFVAFKVLNKDLVNALLTIYFVVLGVLALAGTISPVVTPYVPVRLREKQIGIHKTVKIPLLMDEPAELTVAVPDAIAAVLASPVVAYYVATKHWLANNTLGLAFSVQGLEFLSIGSFKVGAILLAGLFIYDIFWVFGTPVMVSVARNVEAPIKLLFPRVGEAAAASPFSMLGLGDIVIPGIVVALLLRFDAARGRSRPATHSTFHAAFFGYVAGLVLTIVVMNVFDAAQPALLYIVPGVMGASTLNAWWRGEFKELLAYDELPPEDEEEEEGKEGGDKLEEKKDK